MRICSSAVAKSTHTHAMSYTHTHTHMHTRTHAHMHTHTHAHAHLTLDIDQDGIISRKDIADMLDMITDEGVTEDLKKRVIDEASV